MAGRPSIYTKELGEEICQAIATSRKGLHGLCKEHDNFPSVSTIIGWITADKYPEFSASYARAREEQAEFMVEEILEVAYDSSGDVMTINKGGEVIEVENKEFVNRSKLKVDSLKWIAAHLKPKKYADRIDVEHSGTVELKPVVIDWGDKDGTDSDKTIS